MSVICGGKQFPHFFILSTTKNDIEQRIFLPESFISGETFYVGEKARRSPSPSFDLCRALEPSMLYNSPMSRRQQDENEDCVRYCFDMYPTPERVSVGVKR